MTSALRQRRLTPRFCADACLCDVGVGKERLPLRVITSGWL